MIQGLAPEELKRCCADLYRNELLPAVLGHTYHPGGRALTRRMGELLKLRSDCRVLDLASGPGTSALLLAEEFDAVVVGLDRTPELAERAAESAAVRGLSERVGFLVGDAESVPLAGSSVDAVCCECSFCLFPDKPSVAGNMARVLRPGGRVAVADIDLDPASLPEELQGLAGWVSCLAGALPASQCCEVLAGAGFELVTLENHEKSLLEMIDQIESRLILAAIAGVQLPGIDLNRTKELTAMARQVIAAGDAGYSLIVAEKPANGS